MCSCSGAFALEEWLIEGCALSNFLLAKSFPFNRLSLEQSESHVLIWQTHQFVINFYPQRLCLRTP